MSVSAGTPMDRSDLRVEMFTQRFEYHRDLVKRRWEYFVGFIAVDALFLNAWQEVSSQPAIIAATFATCPIMLALVTWKLIHRARQRIRSNAQALNDLANEPVLDVADATLSTAGISGWLYLAILIVSTPWFVLLFQKSLAAFVGVLTAVALVVLAAAAKRK